MKYDDNNNNNNNNNNSGDDAYWWHNTMFLHTTCSASQAFVHRSETQQLQYQPWSYSHTESELLIALIESVWKRPNKNEHQFVNYYQLSDCTHCVDHPRTRPPSPTPRLGEPRQGWPLNVRQPLSPLRPAGISRHDVQRCNARWRYRSDGHRTRWSVGPSIGTRLFYKQFKSIE